MILVLGGSGYIGSHTVKRLLAAGEKVVVYDNLVNGNRESVAGVPLVEGDIADTARLQQVMTDDGVDAVIHFAAFCYVGESVENPLMYYRNNIAGTISVLAAMDAAGVDTIIFSSSAAVFGIPKTVPITESAPRHPINPYGRSKAVIERVLADTAAARGLRYTALRYFNAAGADMDGELGEWHDPETHLIPLAIAAALGRCDSFTVMGGSYDTPDGSCIRDFVHVDDLAEAHVLALERLRSGKESGCFNLGNGAGFSVKEVVEQVRRTAGNDFAVEVGPARPGDPPALVADSTLAGKELGWRPRHSDLETIVSTAYRWLESHPKGYAT
jgi:UDP-glucose-4-epimerase GalE